MRVLVLGAYGLIGSDVVRRLRADGLTVVGFGRSYAKGKRLAPNIDWVGADLATLTKPERWTPYLRGVDAVVNASGALQDGAIDRLEASQHEAIVALVNACVNAGVRRYVQISAPGATPDASTAFMRTKGKADAALRASSLEWTILKPGLVISADAYGGTALLRMLAAFPAVQPLMLPDARLQSVAVSDVADAVAIAITTDRLVRREVDLVERRTHTLAETISAFRSWLGFAPAHFIFSTPLLLGALLGSCADVAGWLGWRSPLRTTALKVLAGNVLGDPDQGQQALGRPLKTLAESLNALPATLQERVFARAQLTFPLLILSLATFWMASGAIALVQATAAAAVLRGTVLEDQAMMLVIGGALLDIAIGVGLCFRKTARRAASSAIIVSLGYIALGTWTNPTLWSDPLGPYVKILPAIALAFAVAALIEER
ncbi:MAG: SDR family oxidoreductase [Hyphomonadaceae bacterium]|nr:SDR family oxidoreductase [Hyphomonadaceae bacterium]